MGKILHGQMEHVTGGFCDEEVNITAEFLTMCYDYGKLGKRQSVEPHSWLTKRFWGLYFLRCQ